MLRGSYIFAICLILAKDNVVFKNEMKSTNATQHILITFKSPNNNE